MHLKMAFLPRSSLTNPILFSFCRRKWPNPSILDRFSQHSNHQNVHFFRRPSAETSTPVWPYFKQQGEENDLLHNTNQNLTSKEDSSETVSRICNSIYRCYEDGDRRLNSLKIDPILSPEQAVTIAALLVEQKGPMVASSFFEWAVGRVEFRHFMRLYITTASSLIDSGNVEKAHDVMRLMVKNFAGIGKLKEAIDMVIEMRNRGLPLSVHTLNSILRISADMCLAELAEYAFVEMSGQGAVPDFLSFKTLIIAFCSYGYVEKVDKLLREMMEKGFQIDNVMCTLIIEAFCEKGHTGRVLGLFEKISERGFSPNLINYTALIDGLCKRGRIKQAFEVLEEMVRRGLKPNVYTHTALIDGLCKKGWTEKAFRLFLKLVRSNTYKPNVCTYTAMIGGYCKEYKMNRAEMLFSRMQQQGLSPNTNTYTVLIDGHGKDGNFARAYQLMDKMVMEGFTPNICTYNAIIDGLCKKGRVQEAYDLIQTGLERGLHADQITYTILITETCKGGNIDRAMDLFDKMIKVGCRPDMYTYTTLIAAFCKQRKMKESERLLDEALRLGMTPTKQTYTSMICGYCRDRDLVSASNVFKRMSEKGCVADSIAYGALISGLCKESKISEARILYGAMVDKGLSPCEVTSVTVAYECCKKEGPDIALVVLDRLDKKAWIRVANILIRKLCSDGEVEFAALLFQKLLDRDPNPNHVTYAGFKSACYSSDRYSVASDLSDRILKDVDKFHHVGADMVT